MRSMAPNPSSHTVCSLLLLVFCYLTAESFGFGVSPVLRQNPVASVQLHAAASDGADDSSASSPPSPLFPVLRKIAGFQWEGPCRYVNEDLIPASLDLRGGIRFDLPDSNDDNDTVELNSFLVFPNGKRRDIEMRGKRGPVDRPSMRLDSTASSGPIYTVITELAPDTVLINEVDRANGRIVMTSSLSLVVDPNDENTITELVQVSHEVGGPTTTNRNPMIEGHQVWRFVKAEES
eukprot:jgi/Psemu1/15723/gm1.15723_g